MSSISCDDGGSATIPYPAGELPEMSLRDWFAGQALACLIRNRDAEMINKQNMQWHAKSAYELADAMLRERGSGATLPIPKPRAAKGQGHQVWQQVGAQAH